MPGRCSQVRWKELAQVQAAVLTWQHGFSPEQAVYTGLLFTTTARGHKIKLLGNKFKIKKRELFLIQFLTCGCIT